MRFTWSLIAALQLTSMSAVAQTDASSEIPEARDLTLKEILTQVNEARARGNELTVLDLLRNLERRYADRPETLQRIAQTSYHFDAVVGNYREAMRHFASAEMTAQSQPQPQSADEFALRKLRPKPALSVIDGLIDANAEHAQIVMINEAHHVPQHRAFTIELLPLLWRKGFRYLAAETLTERDTELQQRGYPIRMSGYYTAEPVYGELIRTALRLGYHVIPYEGTAFRNAEERERTQAQNLADRIFKNDARAKVLIHAGYSHINESGSLAGTTTLARRLTELTGVNPLTIDQTVKREQISAEYENPIYRYVMAHSPVSRPTIFVDAEHRPWTLQPGVRDITLFHPRSRYVNGRPTWLTLGGARRPYKLPRAICGTEPRCLVRARAAPESSDAIPVDELEITADQRAPTLMLPRGEFVIDVQDSAGNTLRTLSVRRR